MRVLVIVGMVTDVAHAHGVGSADPFVAEVLSPPNFIDKLGTHFAFQLLHNLFSTFRHRFAVQPRHRLVISVEVALPLRERSVGHTLFSIPRAALCITTPLHLRTLKLSSQQLHNITHTLYTCANFDRPLQPNTWYCGRPF